MYEYNSLIVSVEENIALVKLNNPDSLNALNDGIKADLFDFFQLAKNDNNIKSIVLTGEGRAFCAGGDINSLKEVTTPDKGRSRIKKLHDLVLLIRNIEKPVIAAVNGYAVGAGFNLALACDIIIGAENCKFSQIFANIGLIPDAGGLYFLPRLVGPLKAKELSFSARMVKAEEAEKIGLVNKIVPLENLLEESIDFAKSLANGPSIAIGYIKTLVNRSMDWDLYTLFDNEAYAQGICLTTEDFIEGTNAFKEKRKPEFKGK